jgi:MurNAc alpha-1-phosphate uridylyltransferase
MSHRPGALMVFAAGFGTRMGALTRDRPKPLLPVAGRPLIDRALDLAHAAGVGRVVANAHYLAEQVEVHLAVRGVPVSREEPRILDTGGGLRRALPLLGPGAVYTLNPDSVWTGENPLDELAATWDPERMGALLMLGEIPGRAVDFALSDDGRVTRVGPMTYLGAQIIDPAILDEIPDAVFSLNRAWDLLASRGRLFGTTHRGGWCDVGTPEGLAAAERFLADV